MLKQAHQTFTQAATQLPRNTAADDWSAALCSIGTVLYQLGVQRRGARTLEQALVAYRNALGERTYESNLFAWAVTQNNLAAAMQGLGEHEEDIGSLEASIPAYEAALKVLDSETVPLVRAMVTANRASALLALATESDYLDMAETAVAEFDRLIELFAGTDYTDYQEKVQERRRQATVLVASLQV
jgi:tetratricopeptide (TPR) repeat protein